MLFRSAGGRGGGRGAGGPPAETFASIAASILGPLNVLQDADEPPVAVVVATANERMSAYRALSGKLDALVKGEVEKLLAR